MLQKILLWSKSIFEDKVLLAINLLIASIIIKIYIIVWSNLTLQLLIVAFVMFIVASIFLLFKIIQLILFLKKKNGK